MDLRDSLIDYLTIKQELKYGEELLDNPYNFFNYDSHVSSNHYKGSISFKNGKVLAKNDDFLKNPAYEKGVETHKVYVKEQYKPLFMHAEVLYSWFFNKSGGTSAVYYPFTFNGTTGVISKDINSFNGGKILNYEEVCPYPEFTNRDEIPYLSFNGNISQFKKLNCDSLVNSYQNLFLRDLAILQYDRHNKNYLIAKSTKNKLYELVAFDNDATRATLAYDDDKINNKSLFVRGLNHYVEQYYNVINELKNDKNKNLITNRLEARKTLNNIANTHMDDIANEIYNTIGFTLDEKFVKKCETGKNIVCNDLDKCI